MKIFWCTKFLLFPFRFIWWYLKSWGFIYIFICLRRVTFVQSYKSNQKSSYMACQFQQAMFCISFKYIEYEAHSHRLVRYLIDNYSQTDLNSLQVKLHEIYFDILKFFDAYCHFEEARRLRNLLYHFMDFSQRSKWQKILATWLYLCTYKVMILCHKLFFDVIKLQKAICRTFEKDRISI